MPFINIDSIILRAHQTNVIIINVLQFRKPRSREIIFKPMKWFSGKKVGFKHKSRLQIPPPFVSLYYMVFTLVDEENIKESDQTFSPGWPKSMDLIIRLPLFKASPPKRLRTVFPTHWCGLHLFASPLWIWFMAIQPKPFHGHLSPSLWFYVTHSLLSYYIVVQNSKVGDQVYMYLTMRCTPLQVDNLI